MRLRPDLQRWNLADNQVGEKIVSKKKNRSVEGWLFSHDYENTIRCGKVDENLPLQCACIKMGFSLMLQHWFISVHLDQNQGIVKSNNEIQLFSTLKKNVHG